MENMSEADCLTLKEHVANLSSTDIDIRRNAATSLAWSWSEAAVPHLLESLRDHDYTVRKTAVRGLLEIGIPEALQPRLFRIIEHGEAWAKCSALNLLLQIDANKSLLRRSLSHIVKMLFENDSEVKFLACSIIISMPGELLHDIGRQIGTLAIVNSGIVSRPSLDDLISLFALADDRDFLDNISEKVNSKSDPVVRLVAFALLARCPNLSFHMISQYVADRDLAIRRLSVLTLGQTKDDHAVPFLESAIYDSEPTVRATAIDALLIFPHLPENTISLLVRCLCDPDQQVRRSVCRALRGRCPRTTSCIQRLLEILTDGDDDTRIACIPTLTLMRPTSTSVILRLIDLLHSHGSRTFNEYVGHAIVFLAPFTEDIMIIEPHLTALSASSNEHIRGVGAQALNVMKRTGNWESILVSNLYTYYSRDDTTKAWDDYSQSVRENPGAVHQGP